MAQEKKATGDWRLKYLLKPLLLPFASELERIKPMVPHESKRTLEEGISLLESLSASNEAIGGEGAAGRIILCLIALQPMLDTVVEFNVRAAGITARAFTHLQRLIIVDKETQVKWNAAFTRGETECEKIGAAHLLLHGIWAFKAHSEKARTDIVLGTPLDLVLETPLAINDEVRRASAPLVLTEWKVVAGRNDLEKKINEAKYQTQDYVSGCLAGFALDAVRFLVMVSRERMTELPKDFIENDITYRCINIAVEPASPSEEARRQARGKGGPKASMRKQRTET